MFWLYSRPFSHGAAVVYVVAALAVGEERAKMPLSGVSARSGDLAWFTFKALDGDDVFIYLIA